MSNYCKKKKQNNNSNCLIILHQFNLVRKQCVYCQHHFITFIFINCWSKICMICRYCSTIALIRNLYIWYILDFINLKFPVPVVHLDLLAVTLNQIAPFCSLGKVANKNASAHRKTVTIQKDVKKPVNTTYLKMNK